MKKETKAILGLFGLIIIGLLMLAFLRAREMPPRLYKQEKILLDTFVTIIIYDKDKPKAKIAAKKAFSEMEKVDRLLNRYNPQSEISKINRKAGQKENAIKVSPLTFKVLSLSKSYEEKLRGNFDITIGPLISSYNFKQKKVPSSRKLKETLSLVDSDSLQLYRETRRVKLEKPGMKIDLGGVAKGYAVDRAISVLKKQGIKSALVSTVSSTGILGSKPRKTSWKVGVQHPRKKDKLMGILTLKNMSLSTSGDYQQYFRKKGVLYHHILDPKTGKPAREVISVTVLTTKGSTEADILSTALFVMGYPEGIDYLNSTPQTEGIIVTKDGKIHRSSGLGKFVKKIEESI